MQSIFDKKTREELITRIESLTENSAAQWGKMNVYQMLKHCTLWEEMIQGRQQYKRMFLGRLFGKMALKGVLKDESPLRRSTPTLPQLKISGNGPVAAQKAAWIDRIRKYEHFSNPSVVHVFFGKMTREQIGQLAFKHTDHHLRQFNS